MSLFCSVLDAIHKDSSVSAAVAGDYGGSSHTYHTRDMALKGGERRYADDRRFDVLVSDALVRKDISILTYQNAASLLMHGTGWRRLDGSEQRKMLVLDFFTPGLSRAMFPTTWDAHVGVNILRAQLLHEIGIPFDVRLYFGPQMYGTTCVADHAADEMDTIDYFVEMYRYPVCCVASYLGGRRWSDHRAELEVLAKSHRTSLDPYILHVPCAVDCAPTKETACLVRQLSHGRFPLTAAVLDQMAESSYVSSKLG